MKSRYGFLILLGLIFLAGAGALMLPGGNQDQEEAKPDHATNREHSRNTKSSSRDANLEVQKLLKEGAELDFQFSKLEHLVRQLNDEGLMQLIEEVGLRNENEQQRWRGMHGWVRSALFAEWGRRDPGALEGLERMLEELAHDSLARYQNGDLTLEKVRAVFGQWYRSEINQACFALFRGRMERQDLTTDAVESLLKEFQRLKDAAPGASWIDHSTSFLFAEFAKTDPEAAWNAVPEKQRVWGKSRHDTAMEGIFRGLVNRSVIEHLVKQWEPAWLSQDARLARVNYQKNTSRMTFHIPQPPEIAIRQEAVMALARHDWERAREWMKETSTTAGEEYFPLSEWASRYPDQAMQLITDPGYREQQRNLAKAVILANPTQAQEVILALPEGTARERVLVDVVAFGRSVRWDDLFPSSERFGVIPDMYRRYEVLQEAIESAGLSEQETARLHENLRASFKDLLKNEEGRSE